MRVHLFLHSQQSLGALLRYQAVHFHHLLKKLHSIPGLSLDTPWDRRKGAVASEQYLVGGHPHHRIARIMVNPQRARKDFHPVGSALGV